MEEVPAPRRSPLRLKSQAWYWLPLLANAWLAYEALFNFVSGPNPPGLVDVHRAFTLPYWVVALFMGGRAPKGISVVDLLFVLLGQIGLFMLMWKLLHLARWAWPNFF